VLLAWVCTSIQLPVFRFVSAVKQNAETKQK